MARRSARLLGRIVFSASLAFLVWVLAVWPPPSWYRAHTARETAFMTMRGREATGREAQPTRRHRPIALDWAATPLLQAVIVAEDRRFFEHGGVDYQAFREAIGYSRREFSWSNGDDRRALWAAVSSLWGRRGQVRGASTITQQLAKNLYLSPSRNPLRKVKEAVTSYRLESALGKHRILELYLNVVELGPEVWGVGAASEVYFGKPPDRLTESEAAWIAATLPAPRSANPGHRPEHIRWRRDLILRRARATPVTIPPVE